jgi:D-sedoheptulose 7-phosphate isomerase
MTGGPPLPADLVARRARESAALCESFCLAAAPRVAQAAAAISACLSAGGKVMAAGNGGSAADAQHFAGELVNRFLRERPPLAGIALSADGAVLTCIGNDYGFDRVFEKQVRALGREGDVLLALSTSGRSADLVRALAAARESGILTIGLLGRDGGPMAPLCDLALVVPSSETPRVQEAHHLVLHILCELVEDALFPDAPRV